VGVKVIGQKHQHIDIGVRKQLAAAKAANGQQSKGVLQARVVPQLLEHAIGQLRQAAQGLAYVAPGGIALAQALQQLGLVGAVCVADCL
jgi:hypothetical protein